MTDMRIFKAVDDHLDMAPLHPGEVLREDVLPFFRLSANELATRLGVPSPVIDEVLAERTPLTQDLAERLGTTTGIKACHWTALQLQWDLWHRARLQAGG